MIFCDPCGRARFAKMSDIEIASANVVKRIDPTVCGRCRADFGDYELATIDGTPICESCAFMLRRPFPLKLKIAAAILAIVVAGTYARNFRFIYGYFQYKSAIRAIERGDFDRAASAYESAARNVPENARFDQSAKLYRGVALYRQKRMKEAIPFLKAGLIAEAPENQRTLAAVIEMCQMLDAFDKKDYDQFLNSARSLENIDRNDPLGAISVASALAAKYAQTGEERFKTDALERIARAKKLLPSTAMPKDQLEAFEDRILHRIDTREIIDPEEYLKRYPAGRPRRERSSNARSSEGPIPKSGSRSDSKGI